MDVKVVVSMEIEDPLIKSESFDGTDKVYESSNEEYYRSCSTGHFVSCTNNAETRTTPVETIDVREDAKAKKRDRSANFTYQEVDLLVDLILVNKHVIENKKSDAATWQLKEITWEKLQNQFNAKSDSRINRSVKVLKAKYDGLKRLLRKKLSQNKLENCGSDTALTSVEEKIYALIDGTQTPGSDPEIFHAITFSDNDNSGIQMETSTTGHLSATDNSLEASGISTSATSDTRNDSSFAVCQDGDLDLSIGLEQYCTQQWLPTCEKLTKKIDGSTQCHSHFTITEKFDDLDDAKKELLSLQLAIAQRELDIKNKQLRNLDKAYENMQQLHNMQMKIKAAELKSAENRK